jgi:DNA topoisomerase I
VLTEFWQQFIGSVNDIKEVRNRVVLDALNDLLEPHIFPEHADGTPRRQCPQCATGQLSLKTGRFGAFVGCSNYPDCNFTRQITPSADGVQGKKLLGEDPATGLEVTLRGGRFGPYLQLGEQIKPPKPKKGEKKQEVEKPKRASVPKGVVPDDIDLEKALGLLRLPREVGISPEDGEPILAGIGRFGSYVKHGKIYANLEDGDEVLTIGLNRAVTLIAEKKANPKKGRRFGADPGKVLGEHPDQGGPVVVKNGRYGPYVSHNGINATITGDKTPETITLLEAVVLLDARADQLGSQPRRAAGRKKAGAPSEAPKGRAKGRKKEAAANPADTAEHAAKPRKKPAAKKKTPKITAAE